MNESREAVARYVRSHPGAHFSAVVEALDQATGQVQHHLSRLVRADRLVRESVHGRTHYYPTGLDDREREVIALLRRETTRDILGRLLGDDGRRPVTLASELDLARSTVEYHVDRLVDHEVVQKRRDENGRVTLSLERPDETARLLRTVDPGYADRLVDRFERLTDTLLEDTG